MANECEDIKVSRPKVEKHVRKLKNKIYSGVKSLFVEILYVVRCSPASSITFVERKKLSNDAQSHYIKEECKCCLFTTIYAVF